MKFHDIEFASYGPNLLSTMGENRFKKRELGYIDALCVQCWLLLLYVVVQCPFHMFFYVRALICSIVFQVSFILPIFI